MKRYMSRRARQLLVLPVLIIVPVSLFITCDEFWLQEQFYPSSDAPLSVSPQNVTLFPDEPQQFTASGGVEPDVFSFSSGDDIGSVDPDNWLFTADDSDTGAGVLTVTDDEGTERSATVFIYDDAELMLAPSENPIVQGERIDLFASGGTPPYSFGPLVDVGPSIRTYDDTGLQPTTLYGYRITAKTANYRSEPSNESYSHPE